VTKENMVNTVDEVEEEEFEEKQPWKSEWSPKVQLVVWIGLGAFMALVYWVMNNINFDKVPKF
jgi:hypothetical protein